MEDGEQFEKRMEMEFASYYGILQMNVEKNDEQFKADISTLDIDPRFTDIKSMKINRSGINIKFLATVLCETNGEEFVTKMSGLTIDGDSSDSLFNRMPALTKHLFGKKWEKSVERQQERMEKRRKRVIDSIR